MKSIPLIADKVNSTFYWSIMLNERNQYNKQVEIIGYSKFQLQNETNDKVNLLMAKCEMLFRFGYLQKSQYIEIFKKQGTLPNKAEDKCVLILKPTDYIIPENVAKNYPYQMREYLTKFYNAILSKKEVKGLRPLPIKDKKSKQEWHELDYFFASHKDLYEFAAKKIAFGCAVGLVNEFVRKTSLKINSKLN